MDNSQPSFHSASTPRIERVRHDLKRRTLTVTDVERITPGMLRITLSGDDLADFVSLGADDHVKILVPSAEGTEERRDYTPRRYDAGPITEWAMNARPGDGLSVGGPRGSAVISNVERWLLIGDETALPAIGRRIEEATAGARITSIAAVADAAEQQAFETKADLTCHWVYRPLHQATDASALLAILSSVVIEPNTFVWVAAEASVTRAIGAHLTEERGYPLSWIKASGYWVKGKADSTEKFE